MEVTSGNLGFSVKDISGSFSAIKKKVLVYIFLFHDIIETCVPKQINVLFSTDSFGR